MSNEHIGDFLHLIDRAIDNINQAHVIAVDWDNKDPANELYSTNERLKEVVAAVEQDAGL